MMKRLLSLMITALLLITLLSASAFAADFYQPGDVPEDFTVQLCDGSTFTLSEALSTHKIVMINIWASWCGPCRMEFPFMEEAYAAYMKDVALVCLSIDEGDTNDKIIEYMQENGLSILPMGQDTADLGSKIVQEGYPTTIIIDQSGTYVYYECGSMTSVEQFTRMFDTFLSDSHVPGEVLNVIPAPPYEGEYPDVASLNEAANAEGAAFSFSNVEGAWPFTAQDGGIANSNTHADRTVAKVTATVTASQGDVFKYVYETDTSAAQDVLTVTANGEVIDIRSGMTAGTFAWQIPADGEYEFVFTYSKDENADENSDTVRIGDVCLLSGDEGAAALAAMPVYPYTLEGTDAEISILSEGVKEIVFYDPDGIVKMNIGTDRAYLVEGDTADIGVKLGKELDARIACALGDYDGDVKVLANCEYDNEGYRFSTILSSVELGGYSNTYVLVYPDPSNYSEYAMIVIFKSEENVNYFVKYELMDLNYETYTTTWSYADGTLPSTDALPEIASVTVPYMITVVDANGAPVEGVMVNVCTDEFCQPTFTDESGEIYFESDPCSYTIHVLSVPEGYSFDMTQEFVMDELGGELTITLQ